VRTNAALKNVDHIKTVIIAVRSLADEALAMFFRFRRIR
jgi:hypothetical protein